MALIVLQHTVVDNFDVDPTSTVNSSTRILQGVIVGLNASSYLSLPSTTVPPLGIAGDSMSDEYKTTPYAADLIIGRGIKYTSTDIDAAGSVQYVARKRWSSNRVSDMYNETAASERMSVYTTGGRFATDQYVTTDAWTSTNPGTAVYSNSSGQVTLTAGGSALARAVGFFLKAPSEYSSGVPGTDNNSYQKTAGEGSMSLGTFLQFQLSV